MSDGLRVNVLHLELLERVTMSKCLMGNLIDKVGYDGLIFFKENHPVGYRELPSQS